MISNRRLVVTKLTILRVCGSTFRHYCLIQMLQRHTKIAIAKIR